MKFKLCSKDGTTIQNVPFEMQNQVAVPKTTFNYDTNCKFRNPKTTFSFYYFLENSLNTLKAIMFIIMIYLDEIYIAQNQPIEEVNGAESRKGSSMEIPVIFLSAVRSIVIFPQQQYMMIVMECSQIEIFTRVLVIRDFIGVSIYRYS